MATLRLLFKRPGYALACIAILALGIGANTAIFTVLYPVLLRPLLYPDADRLVLLSESFPELGMPFGQGLPASRMDYEAWRAQATALDEAAGFLQKDLNDARTGEPPVTSLFASADLFALLGARAQQGRLFTADDDRKEADPVAVLSDAFFEARFHRDAAAIGQSIVLSGTRYTVAGVLPQRFHLPAFDGGETQWRPDVWLPLAHVWTKPEDDRAMLLSVVGRLRPGVSVERARTEMGQLVRRLFETDPARHPAQAVNVVPLAEENASPAIRRTLYLLLGAVGFVLLIGCANLANLTLVRAAGRSREIAVRQALGATRTAIVRQLLGESLLLALLGAGAGLLLAKWAVQAILALEPPGLDRPDQIYVGLPVFVFTAALCGVATLLFGLAPAVTASRTGINDVLRSSGGGGASARRSQVRQVLIVTEVALALILVTGAALTLRSFANVVRTGIGIETSRYLAADVTLPEDRYSTPASRTRAFEEWRDRVQAMAGVEAVTLADALPMHRVNASSFEIAGRPQPATRGFIGSDFAHVGTEYFRTLRLSVLLGRDFVAADADRDPAGGDGVVIVNQAFARQFFPDGPAVGQRLVADEGRSSWTIVGVAADYRATGAEQPVRPQRFYPGREFSSATLIVRTAGDPAALASGVRGALAAIDPALVADPVQTLQRYLDRFPDMMARRFTTLLLGVFAALALVLAMTGVYSVVANLVASRTREIGIRMALGATSRGIGGMVLLDTLRPVIAGVALGAVGSLALGRVLASWLRPFDMTTHDPATVVLAIALVLLVTPLAVSAPLWRATRVRCTVALREE